MRDVLNEVRGLALALAALAPLSAAHAATVVYNVDQTIGSGTVVGTISTDGTTGVVGIGNIVGWALTLSSGGATYALNTGNSVIDGSGADLTATASNLLFNYSGTDYGYLLFQDGLYSGSHYYCNQATQVSVCAQGASVVPQSYLDPSFQAVARSGDVVIGTTGVSAVPLPSTLPMFGAAVLAVAGLGSASRRRRAGARGRVTA